MPTAVPRLWPGEPFVVVGAGPSLLPQDKLEATAFCRVVAVNDAYQAGYADVLYAADADWWRQQRTTPDGQLPPLKFTAQPSSLTYRPTAKLINVVKGYGISTDPSRVHSGGHGGHQAINLAVLLGASSIVLLGFDFQPGPTGQHHFFGDHPNRSHVNYSDKIRHFSTLAADLAALDIPIVNCSRATAIPDSVIRRRPLAETLRDLAAHRRADGSRIPDTLTRIPPDTPEAHPRSAADDLRGPDRMDLTEVRAGVLHGMLRPVDE